MGDQPGGVGEDAFAVGDDGRLVGWVVPCFPVDVPVRGDLLSAHLLAGPSQHVATVPEAHCHLHIRHAPGLAFAEMEFQCGHHSLQPVQQRLVVTAAHFAEFPYRQHERFMGGDVAWLPGLPVEFPEVLVDLVQLICPGLHRLVIA